LSRTIKLITLQNDGMVVKNILNKYKYYYFGNLKV